MNNYFENQSNKIISSDLEWNGIKLPLSWKDMSCPEKRRFKKNKRKSILKKEKINQINSYQRIIERQLPELKNISVFEFDEPPFCEYATNLEHSKLVEIVELESWTPITTNMIHFLKKNLEFYVLFQPSPLKTTRDSFVETLFETKQWMPHPSHGKLM